MLEQLRQNIVQKLWENYKLFTNQITAIENVLKLKNIRTLFLDHFAIIDLPGKYSGISVLKQLFSLLAFEVKGNGYLADKQNDFCWLAEENCEELNARHALAQIVVADFRLHEMPVQIRNIIQKYAAMAKPIKFDQIESLVAAVKQGNTIAAATLTKQYINYFQGRDWPAPTVAEFKTVQAFNELLAWVLVFGRQPNHFTLSVHLLNAFNDLQAFQDFIKQQLQLSFNEEGGVIKGGETIGIAQSSTQGTIQKIELADGVIDIPTGFVEFVWRYPLTKKSQPTLWGDYFTGFIPQHANRIIESIYQSEELYRQNSANGCKG